jgi:hypothetical protein
MLENINVRFFITEFEGEDENTFEIPHQDFVERYAEQPSARIDIEHCTVRSNGIRQLCITLNAVDHTKEGTSRIEKNWLRRWTRACRLGGRMTVINYFAARRGSISRPLSRTAGR